MQLFAQSEHEIDEDIKMLLYTSVEYDGNRGTKTDFEKWLNIRKNHYDYFNIEMSSIKTFYKPVLSDSIMDKFEIQLYKMEDINSKEQARYLMWYKDFSSEVWVRISGYVENDFHLLLKYFRKPKINKSKLRRMIQEWKSSDEMFKELDWDCLFKGSLKGHSKSECFRSAFYIKMNNASVGFDPLMEKELNSIFSRMPLYGRFEK